MRAAHTAAHTNAATRCCRLARSSGPLRRFATALPGLLLALTLLAGCSRESVYRAPFAPWPAERIPELHEPKALAEDLAQFRRAVVEATPQLDAVIDEDRLLAAHAAIEARIDQPLDRRRFTGLLREAAAAYGIGHVYVVSPAEDWSLWMSQGGRTFASSFADVDGRLVIRPPADAGAPRTEHALVTLGAFDAVELRALLRSRISADTEDARTANLAAAAPRLLWELGLEPPLAWEARASDGTILRGVDPGATPAEARDLFASPTSERTASTAASTLPWSVRWLDDGIAVLQWDRMDPRVESAWNEAVEQLFDDLDARGAAGLIVDVRRNGGGTSSLAMPLLDAIATRPYRFASGKVWRRSEIYDNFLESCLVWWARLLPWRLMLSPTYAGMAIGEERVLSNEFPNAAARTPRFRGPVAFLIGPGTFSSAMMVADAVRTYDLGVLIGRPTGGLPNSHGEVGFVRLANSGLVVSFCSARFLGASGDPTDTNPVLPHIVSDLAGDALVDMAADELRRRKITSSVAPSTRETVSR
jgi:hypothetical protein